MQMSHALDSVKPQATNRATNSAPFKIKSNTSYSVKSGGRKEGGDVYQPLFLTSS